MFPGEVLCLSKTIAALVRCHRRQTRRCALYHLAPVHRDLIRLDQEMLESGTDWETSGGFSFLFPVMLRWQGPLSPTSASQSWWSVPLLLVAGGELVIGFA